MPEDPNDILQEYEREHRKNLAALAAILAVIYGRYLTKIFLRFPALVRNPAPEKLFLIDSTVLFKRVVETHVNELLQDLEKVTVKSINKGWALGNTKNDNWLLKLFKGRKIPEKYLSHNEPALQAFVNRKRAGLTLSERVWILKPQILAEIEATLQDGIATGRAAARMATELKVHLKNPDLIFRRVRDQYGKLQLSKAAQAYHPGRGIYRSSYRNALRLALNETNMAYRAADHERWKSIDFVLGYEVRLSNNHTIYDICDIAAGRYPKTFKFIGWHTRCRCHAVPIIPGEETFDRYLDSIMEGKDPSEFQFTGHVESAPRGLTNWVKDNTDRINGWKNKPYFLVDNLNYFKSVI